ncbi:MAG: hypothetical protein IJT95_02665 [Abditibacteriota bacterium]|nr:hypothetical protein [Abditibacteriota bacterium]
MTIDNSIPEYYKKYVSDSLVFSSEIFEYPDVVIICKHFRPYNTRGISHDRICHLDEKGLTGPEGARWVKLCDEQDKIYEQGVSNSFRYSISALTVLSGPTRYWELYYDILLHERVFLKPVVLRYTHQELFRVGGSGVPVFLPKPETSSLIGRNVLRLKFIDGSTEHWKIIPEPIDIKYNLLKFGGPESGLLFGRHMTRPALPWPMVYNEMLFKPRTLSRNLLWWNKKGSDGYTDLLTARTPHSAYKAWNYLDSPKEPVYK